MSSGGPGLGGGGAAGGRKQFARGQATRGANSGPAVMLMPPHIRATFMPNPPLPHLPPLNASLKRKHAITGVSSYLPKCLAANDSNKNDTDDTKKSPTTTSSTAVAKTPLELKQERQRLKAQHHEEDVLQPLILEYRKMQKDCGGELHGMNCYNTLFIGRLAYEVTERKLLREMETFGLVKDIKIIKERTSTNTSSGDAAQATAVPPKSRGYAFIEYEHEDDMKRAYRAADGMRLEGREIVVDVERGHTVPTWLPRRLGGGLGGTRLGGKDVNVTRPGRFDPSRPEPGGGGGGGMMMQHPPQPYHHAPPSSYPPPAMGRGGGPPPPSAMYGRDGGGSMGRGGGYIPGGPPPPPAYAGDRYGDRGGPPPPPRGDWDRSSGGGPGRGGPGGGSGGNDWDRKRRRSNSPDRRHGSSSSSGGGGGRDSRRRY